MTPDTHVQEAVTNSAMSKLTQIGGWGGAFVAWLGSSQAVAVIGVAVAVLGLLMNFIFNLRRDIRESEDRKSRQMLQDLEIEHLKAESKLPKE